MNLYAEIWARPGAPIFGRVIDDPPRSFSSFHDGINLVGDGRMQLPSTFDRFDEILLIDHVTPANCVSSLVRVFDDSDPTTPIFEWLPQSILPTTDKFDPNVDIAGEGIKSLLRHARVEAWDWDGTVSFAPQFPDWIYGGSNILQNPGIETNTLDPEIYELWNDRSGGTFTVDAGGPPTAALAENISAASLETALQGLAEITDVLVTGTGTEADPWRIEFVDPGFDITLSVTDTGLVSTLTLVNAGGLIPSPWTKSQQISFGVPKIFGTYASDGFRVSSGAEPVLSGSHSLRVNGLTQYAGAQQVVNVKPGGTYQLLAPLYTSDSGDLFRFVVRDINGGLIYTTAASTTGNVGGWDQTTFVITDLMIPDGITQVIVRFAYVGTGNPSPFYLDDLEMNEGLAPTTVGAILGDLYADATSDHSAVRIVWEDEANPGNPYLTLDFSDSVDSAGAAWFHPAISVRLWMRMSYLQVMDQFASTWGYEWRIVPDDVEAGSWLLQVYNPGTMKTDYTAAASPAIQGGSQDVQRSIQRVLPLGTDSMVEGLLRLTARYRESDLATALGLIEASRLDRELPGLDAIIDASYEDALASLVGGLSYSYSLVDPPDLPLVAYQLGDLLIIEDPPEVSDEARLIDVEVVVTPQSTIFEVQFIPATAAGS